MPMDNVTLENTQQSISSRDAKSVASVMVNGKWVNLSDTLEQANVKSDVGTVSKQVAEQQTVITSAVAQADSAVAYANDAIEKSKVNSQAIDDINSAVSDAKQGANDAMSRAMSAWAEATTATSTASSAQSSAQSAIAKTAALSTNVNVLQGTVTTLQAESITQADEIKNKVTQSDVTGMLAGYATQDYTQSLVTQKANDWNLNLTNLKTDVNAIKTTGGGVNLWINSKSFANTAINNPTVDWNTGSDGIATAHITSTTSSGGFYGKWNAIYANSTEPFAIGDSETFSVEMKGSGTFTIGREGDFTKVVTLTSNWTRYAVSGTVNSANKAHIIYHAKSESCDAYVRLPMVEKGTVAHDWSPAPSDMATVTSVTNLSATVDGIKNTVATKADQSTVTELSNLVQTKVSSGDFTSTTTQLKNLINQRVQVGDVISQINQEAGGDTLIQVSNGKKSLILDAANTIITGEAWIPGAAIGSLDASKLTFYGANNTYATMGASVAQYDDDQQKSTINLQYNGGIEIHSSNQQGSILTMHDNTIRLASKSWGDNPNAYQYSGFYAAPNYSLMNTYHRDGTTSGVAIDDNQIHIYGSSKDQQLGALQADVGWYSINGKTGLLTGDQITLKSASTQATLTDRNINIANTSDTNDKNYDVAIHVKGWAEMTGWFTCMGITQTSLLSAKTRIEPLDTKVALDKIASTNVETYQFKSDVAKGKTKRHASVIIDDVNDVAEYYTPEEFISENRMGRDDGDIIGYLMGAVQELKKQLDELKEKI